ncbi:hypothetical protein Tco_0305102 [Tanacetum coccineum]
MVIVGSWYVVRGWSSVVGGPWSWSWWWSRGGGGHVRGRGPWSWSWSMVGGRLSVAMVCGHGRDRGKVTYQKGGDLALTLVLCLIDGKLGHSGLPPYDITSMAKNEPSGSIQTWDALRKIFLAKYCPPARTAKKMEEINNFQQEPQETLYQVWEIFKDMLLRCPQHYLTEMQEVVLFYKALNVPTRQILGSKGPIPSMKAADAKKAIQEMADHLQ